MQVRHALVAALVTMAFARPDAQVAGAVSDTGDAQGRQLPLLSEHRYRIVGRVRLLFFWTGAREVGGARLTRRGAADTNAIALLIGSDPARAPKSMNEWGYIREHVRGETADVFGVRTMQDADSVEKAKARLAEQSNAHLFGILCSSITSSTARSTTTTVEAPRDVTYAATTRLLDVVARSDEWKTRDLGRPKDAAAGFLHALDRLIHASVRAARREQAGPALKTVSYVYRSDVNDLRLEKTEKTDLTVGPTLYSNLIRGTFVVRNRTTGSTTEFTVTYGTDGGLAEVPVHAAYEPHWWLKIELLLDDSLAVPPDPAADRAVLDRIERICRRH